MMMRRITQKTSGRSESMDYGPGINRINTGQS